MVFVYGPSMGETGDYGSGDIVKGLHAEHDPERECWMIDSEPVFNVFIVVNGDIIPYGGES